MPAASRIEDSLAWSTSLFLCLIFTSNCPGQTAEVEDFYFGKPVSSVPANTIYRLLRNSELETTDFQEEKPLNDLLQRIENILAEKGIKVRLVIDQEAFLLEDPKVGPLENFLVRFPAVPKRMSSITALRLVLERIPIPAVPWVRSGEVVITTETRAQSPFFVLHRLDLALIPKRPLTDALDQLSDLSGVSILLDPRVGKKARFPVSARFSNVRLENAVLLLADMAGLEPVVLQNIIYVTHPDNARTIRKKPLLHLDGFTQVFQDEPLEDILDRLFPFNLVLDRRVAKQARVRLTARFLNPVNAGTALRCLTDMASLDAAVLDNVAYVSSPENLRRMEKRSVKGNAAR